MKKIALLLLVPMLYASCTPFQGKGIKVKIHNDSHQQILGLKVSTSEKLDSIEVSPMMEQGEKVDTYLDMKKNKTDGSYTVEFARADGRKEFTAAGYYTNGGPLQRSMEITIENDTVIVHFSGIAY